MKLLRWGERGAEKPGVLDAEERIRDLSSIVADIDGTVLGDPAVFKDIGRLPVVAGSPRIGACVGSVGKMICIGLNYADHAAESGLALPAEPIIFFKATSSICGPDDDLVLPKGSSKVDWEVELGVVIGRALRTAPMSQRHAVVSLATASSTTSRNARGNWSAEANG